MTHPRRIAALLILHSLCLAAPAAALVNPSLQPIHLFEQHAHVAALRVESIDVENKTVRLVVERSFKGTLSGPIEISLASEAAVAASDALIWNGAPVVAFAGGQGRGRKDDLLLYAGAGRWQSGRIAGADQPAKWLWEKDLEQGMFGTFNGRAERLAAMMSDAAAGQYYFPASPVAQFGDAIVIDRLPQAIRGVALYDLDRDGRADIVACSPAGNRVYLQTAPLTFTDRTEALGLAGIASPSVGVADENADGLPDLLLGARIYLATGSGAALRYAPSDLLPAGAGDELKTASFVEINGDGYPDVVVSRAGRGLRAYLHPGRPGGAYRDATAALGLDRPTSDGDGFFASGDFNADGRTDLFYGVGNGMILLQSEAGAFVALEHDLEYELTSTDPPGVGGTASFAPLLGPDSRDLIFSTEVGVHLLTRDADDTLRDVTGYGNELMETSLRQLALIAEDLDADGTVDLFVASRDDLPFKFFANRGYGSFTVPNKYKPGIFPDAIRERGFWGLAAGDADSDGANDLLLGGIDGSVMLLVNKALTGRADKTHPNIQEKLLQQTRIVTVDVRGRIGVLGAEVTLADAQGRVVGRRMLGGNHATGCRGPDVVNLAVRDPGALTLQVRYADGHTRTWPLDVPPGQRTLVTADRE